MAITPTSLGLTFDLTRAESVQKSQRWVLVSMQEFGPALVTMLWRILGREEDVCDAYQDTFLRLAHLPDEDKPANVRSYLFRTASNVAISMLRHKQLQRKHLGALSKECETSHHDFVKDLDAANLQQRLRQAIAELPEYLGNVIVLRDLAQMPYPQVAQIWGFEPLLPECTAIKQLNCWLRGWQNQKSGNYYENRYK